MRFREFTPKKDVDEGWKSNAAASIFIFQHRKRFYKLQDI